MRFTYYIGLLIILLLTLSTLNAQEKPVEVKIQEGHQAMVEAITFSKDGKWLVSAAGEEIILWETNTGKELRRMAQAPEYVMDMVFLDNTNQIIVSGRKGMLLLYDLKTGKVIHNFIGHKANIPSIDLNAEANKLVSASADGQVKVWDLATKASLLNLEVAGTPFQETVFRQGSIWAWAKTGKVFNWNSKGTLLQTLELPTQDIYAVAFSPDGKSMALGRENPSGKDAFISLFSLDEKRILRDMNAYNNDTPIKGLHQLAFSPDGKYILAGGGDVFTLRLKPMLGLWDASTGKDLQSFSTQDLDGIAAVAFLPQGNRVIAGGRNMQLQGKLISYPLGVKDSTAGFEYSARIGDIQAATFSPDAKYILFGNDSPKLWDMQTGKIIKGGFGEPALGIVKDLAFSPDNLKAIKLISERGQIFYQSYNTLNGEEMDFAMVGFDGDDEPLEFSKDSVYTSYETQNLKIAITEGRGLVFKDTKTNKVLATLYTLIGNNEDFLLILPDGRFDGTPKGMEELLHFVVENESISLSQLKARYYEPNLWARLMGYSEEKLREVPFFDKVALYPSIALELLKPSDDKSLLSIKLQNRGGGIGEVLLHINGREVITDARTFVNQNPKSLENQNQLEIQINLQDKALKRYFQPYARSLVQVFVRNAEGYLLSKATEITVNPVDLSGSKGKLQEELEDVSSKYSRDNQSLYVLSIGVQEYANPAINLRFSGKDAADMAKALEIAGKRLFEDENKGKIDKVKITVISSLAKEVDKKPTKENIVKAFKEIAAKATHNDVLLVYLSGHGIGWGGAQGDFYFLTQDANAASASDYTDLQILKPHSVSSTELTEMMKEILAMKQVVIIDACGSGKAVDMASGKKDLGASTIKALDLMNGKGGMFIITGCEANAVSYESYALGQGLLTYSLLEKMKNGDKIEVAEWFRYAKNRVPHLIQNSDDPSRRQEPRIFGSDAQIFVGIVTEEDKARIPLATPKPVLVRALFLDKNEMNDALDLTAYFNKELSDLIFSQKDKNLPFTFMDLQNYPDAYYLSGFYEKQGDTYLLKAVLKRNKKELIEEFEITGANQESLYKSLLSKVKSKLR